MDKQKCRNLFQIKTIVSRAMLCMNYKIEVCKKITFYKLASCTILHFL